MLITTIGQTKTVASIMKKKIFISKKINSGINKTFIGTFLWRIALHGCETCVIHEVEKRSSEAFEMWRWRRMEKIIWAEGGNINSSQRNKNLNECRNVTSVGYDGIR